MNKEGQIKHNNQIFRYSIGGRNIIIQPPDNKAETISKYKIKGMARPNLLRRLIDFGDKVEVKRWEIKNYIERNY